VTLAMTPALDPGRFDLHVNSTVVKAAAGDGETGTLGTIVPGSTVTVSAAAVGGTDPAAYDTSINCGSGPQAGTSLMLTNVTSNLTCVVQNVRKAVPPPPPPLPALTLTGLSIAPKKFAPGTSTIAFNLSRPATVVYKIDRLLEGKTRRGRCTVTNAARKSGPRCIRYDPLGRLAVDAVAGGNRVAFDGRLNGAALPAGRYRLRAMAVSGADTTTELSVRFRVL